MRAAISRSSPAPAHSFAAALQGRRSWKPRLSSSARVRSTASPPAPTLAERVHVIGASGRSGAAICRALAAAGIAFVPLVRDSARWTGSPTARLADLTDPAALRAALAEATCVVSAAHARHTQAILAAAPPDARLVLLGSTRRFSRWPDEHGAGVIAGERAFVASGRPGIMLHPTMIYGAQGEDNVRRLAAMIARLPFVPLPGGGRALVQPIHQDDVTRAIMASVARDWDGATTLVIAGPQPLPYADFVRAVARARGLPPPRVVPAPAWPLMAASLLTRLPLVPTIRAAEIRRLLEDKAFDVAPMIAALGFTPVALDAGLARTFGASSSL